MGVAVAGHVPQPAGELVLAGRAGRCGVAERAGGGHDSPAVCQACPVAVRTRNPAWPSAWTAVTGVLVRMSAPRAVA